MSGASIALVGLGAWGRNHYRVLCELGALRLAWDRDPETLAEVAACGLRARGWDAILGDDGVRGIVVATPARSHYELARQALDAGKDVLVEKPLTLDEVEGEDLVRRAAERRRVLMVGHISLYHPAVQALGELVRDGVLGRLRYVYANRLNLGTVREEEDILWSFAPHDVALMLELLGSWPRKVLASGGSYLRAGRADVTVTHLEFGDDVQAHIFVSWLHPMKEHRLVVIGDRKMAVFADGPEGGELRVYDCGVDLVATTAVHRRAAGELVGFPRREPLRGEIQEFLDCVSARREPLTGGRHGLAVLRVLETAQASLRQGGVPLVCRPLGEAVRHGS
jgi:UDP-2-acetamido-3-amino-2,3-dideoxy-glucuronate N-acetyltransferase